MASSHSKRPLSDPNTPPPSSTGSASKKRQIGPASSVVRTGQACDRCKIRKIRCDDTDGGCAPCRQNNVECKTSDRITGRAVVRGHTEHLEKENEYLKQRNAELEAMLHRQPAHAHTDPALLSPPYKPPTGTAPYTNRPRPSLSADGRAAAPSTSPPESGLVVATSLSQPTGFTLDVFGMKIDFSSFVANTDPFFQVATSFEAFHDAFFNMNQDRYDFGEALLPDSYETCIELVKQYIYGVSPWIPVVHPPDLFATVDRAYDGTGRPPLNSEMCMLHMALAGIHYHNGVRNKLDDALRRSFAHYHYVLQRFSSLLRSRTLKDFQAMTMFCGFVRAFPRPTVCWYATHSTMLAAVEMGLHRSINAFPELKATASSTDIQMRKCIYWTLLMTYVALAGKFGRPMLVQRSDFDIELPEPTETTESMDGNAGFADNSLSFSFAAMAYFFRLGEIFLDTYNIIYAVRPDGKYDEHLEEIEARHNKWKRQLPASMSRGTIESREPKNMPFATYIANWSAELDLTLHHPAVCRTKKPETAMKNLTICISATSVIIQTTAELLATKSLDSTWTQVLIYTAALFTSLFAYWERRNSISMHDLQRLKQDVDVGLNILASMGQALGTNDDLRQAVQQITDRCFANLENHLRRKSGQPAKAIPPSHNNPLFTSSSAPSDPLLNTQYLPRAPSQASQTHTSAIPTSHNNFADAFSLANSSINDPYSVSYRTALANDRPAHSNKGPMNSLALSLVYPRQSPSTYAPNNTNNTNTTLLSHWAQFTEMNNHTFLPSAAADYDSQSTTSGSLDGTDGMAMAFSGNNMSGGLGMPNLLPPSGHLDVPVVNQMWPMTIGYQTGPAGGGPARRT